MMRWSTLTSTKWNMVGDAGLRQTFSRSLLCGVMRKQDTKQSTIRSTSWLTQFWLRENGFDVLNSSDCRKQQTAPLKSWPYKGKVLETLCITGKCNWMAPWKNRISSTIMKLRKSLVKPVTWQNISSCLVHSRSSSWKNRTTWYNCRFSAASLALRVFSYTENVRRYNTSCTRNSGGRTEQNVVIGFGELAAVD